MSIDDAIVFFPFSDGSGDTTPDVAGGRTGLLRGGAGVAEGRVGTGLALPGAGGFAELANEPGFDLAAGTLAFWVRPDAIGAAQGLAGRDSAGFGAGEMSVLLRADGRVSFRLETAGKTFFAQSDRALTAGDWAHVAVSWGPGGMQLRLDGALDGASSHAGGLAGNVQPWVIGANASVSGTGNSLGLRDHFAGTIDEVALFDRQLDAADLAALIAGADGSGGNAAPVVAAGAPDAAVVAGEAFDFALPADAFSDPDGDALTLTASAADGGALPAWLGFDGARFTGTPPADAVGTLALRVTASDAAASAQDDFMIEVAAAPAAAGPIRLTFASQTGRAKIVDLAEGFWADAPRVMPLGDSNTLGLSNTLPTGQLESYRARALVAGDRGPGPGSTTSAAGRNGPASLPDRNHLGVSGIRATHGGWTRRRSLRHAAPPRRRAADARHQRRAERGERRQHGSGRAAVDHAQHRRGAAERDDPARAAAADRPRRVRLQQARRRRRHPRGDQRAAAGAGGAGARARASTRASCRCPTSATATSTTAST